MWPWLQATMSSVDVIASPICFLLFQLKQRTFPEFVFSASERGKNSVDVTSVHQLFFLGIISAQTPCDIYMLIRTVFGKNKLLNWFPLFFRLQDTLIMDIKTNVPDIIFPLLRLIWCASFRKLYMLKSRYKMSQAYLKIHLSCKVNT